MSAPIQPNELTAPHFAELLENHAEGILLFDSEFRIVYANAAARRISRLEDSDIGRTQWEVYPQVLGTSLEEAYRRVQSTRVAESIPDFYFPPLGIWFRLRAVPVGEGFALYYKDVSDEHRISDEVSRIEDRFVFALQAANGVGAWDWDIPNNLVYSDANFARIYGVDPEKARHGVPIGDFFRHMHPEDARCVREQVEQSLSTCGNFVSQYRLIQPDGSFCWVSTSGRVVPDADGKPSRFPGVAVDITAERAQAEELHKQYESAERHRRELSAIYDGSPIGMALYEPTELRLTRINARQAEIFRMTPEEAIGKRYEEITAGVPEVHALMQRAAQGEVLHNQDVQGAINRFPNEQRAWNVNYTPIFDESGNVIAVASATIEVTAQKRAEAALIQAEKLAAVGRLASSIAHEINNPLEAVTNLIYLARTNAILPEVRQFLDLAEAELRRVAVIANGTLRFHKQSTRPVETNCDDLFNSVMTLHEGRLRNSPIEVRKRSRAKRTIMCLEGDIRQVLNNLVGNSIDAMPRGGKLFLRTRETTDWPTGRPGLALTVADTGSGMSPETLQRVFEAFYTTKGNSGTGLGLWISKDIVDRHEGRLSVRSSRSPQHHGTVFTLFLPFDFAGQSA